MHRLFSSFGAVLLLTACEQTHGGGGEDRAFVIDTIATWGEMEGPPGEVLGLVRHAAWGDDGRLYVLDDVLSQVRVFDQADLRHVFDFGRPGEGPSEFQSPMGIAYLPGGRLVVGDGGMTFKVLEFTDQGARTVSTFNIGTKADDFCAVDGDLFVRAWDDTALIHRFSPAGEELGSFGEGWESESYLTRQERSEGIVGCHDDADVVLAMFHFDPRIFGYSPDGSRLWVSRIPDHHQARIEEGTTAGGRPRVTFYDDPPHDMAVKIVPFGPDHVLVQLALITTVDGSRTPAFRVYLVSVHDGTVHRVADGVPLLLSAAAPRLFMADFMPFPRLVLTELRNAGQ